jgi:hypothetical protein
VGAFTSELRFEDDTEPEITETSLVVSGGYRWGPGWSARLTAGAVMCENSIEAFQAASRS